jgi:Ribonuclease G/E
MGYVKSHESLALEIIRLLNLAVSKDHIRRIELTVSPAVGDYLQNEKRTAIAQIELATEKRIIIHSSPEYPGEQRTLLCLNDRGGEVKL